MDLKEALSTVLDLASDNREVLSSAKGSMERDEVERQDEALEMVGEHLRDLTLSTEEEEGEAMEEKNMESKYQVMEIGEVVVIPSNSNTIRVPWMELSPMLKMSMESEYDQFVREKANLRKEWREGSSSLSKEKYERMLKCYDRNIRLVEEKMEHVKAIKELEDLIKMKS